MTTVWLWDEMFASWTHKSLIINVNLNYFYYMNITIRYNWDPWTYAWRGQSNTWNHSIFVRWGIIYVVCKWNSVHLEEFCNNQLLHALEVGLLEVVFCDILTILDKSSHEVVAVSLLGNGFTCDIHQLLFGSLLSLLLLDCLQAVCHDDPQIHQQDISGTS